jgi:uncharacterized membrane protein
MSIIRDGADREIESVPLTQVAAEACRLVGTQMIAYCSEPEYHRVGTEPFFAMTVRDLKRLSTDLRDRPGSAENGRPGVMPRLKWTRGSEGTFNSYSK